MAHPPSSLTELPGDLIDYVLDYLSPRILASVCLVSKCLHSYAHRALYRDLFMSSPTQMLKCCETLVSNATAASAVRTVSVRFTYEQNARTQSESFYTVVKAAFMSLPDVLALEVLVSAAEFVRVLAECRWPRLHRFQSFLPTRPELLQFVGRHPTLRTTFFSYDCDPSILSPVHLPNVEKFIGPSPLVPFVIPGSRAETVNLVSPSAIWELEPALVAIQESTATVTHFSVFIEDWDVDLLYLLPTYLPDLIDLTIRNTWLDPEKSSSHTVFLRTIAPLLKDFNRLQSLTLISDDKDGEDLTLFMSLLDIEAVIAGGFGLSCPSLMTCTMTSGVTWFKLQSCVWIPQNNRPKGRAWMRHVLDTGVHPVVNNLDEETASLIMTSIRNVLRNNPEWYGEENDEDYDGESDEGYGYLSDHS